MADVLDASGLRDAIHGPHQLVRTITLYAESEACAPAVRSVPAASLFPEASGYRRHYADDAERLPRLVHAEDVSGRLTLPAEYPVEAAWLIAFQLPLGARVLGIALGLRAPVAVTELVVVLDARRDEITVDGELWCSPIAGARLGPDFHHLTFLPDGTLRPSLELDADAMQRLVSRRTDASRARFLTVRLPAEPNRFADMACALTPGASVVAGHGTDVQLAMALSAVQALASLATLRTLQRRTHETVVGLLGEPDAGDRPTWLAHQAAVLSRLELELSFGVEANLAMRLYVPSLPIEQFHNELLDALGVPAALQVTDRMLSRLTSALDAERAAVAAEERKRDEARIEEDEKRWRRWGAIGGSVAAVAVPITLVLAFLGINASQVDATKSALDWSYAGWYVLLVGVVAAAALVGLWVAKRR